MVYLRNELRSALRYVPLRNELRNGKLRNDVSTQESLRKPQVALRWSRYVAPVLRYDGRYVAPVLRYDGCYVAPGCVNCCDARIQTSKC